MKQPDVFDAMAKKVYLIHSNRDTAAKLLRVQEEEGGDLWNTSCHNCFTLNDGTPTENKMTFCCFCGGHIQEDVYQEEGA